MDAISYCRPESNFGWVKCKEERQTAISHGPRPASVHAFRLKGFNSQLPQCEAMQSNAKYVRENCPFCWITALVSIFAQLVNATRPSPLRVNGV
jgi:hypothetical protein